MQSLFYKMSIIVLASLVFQSCNKSVGFKLPEENKAFVGEETYNNKVDILFVVDDSTSMKEHQEELSRVVPELISQLNSLKMDYQVAVTSSTTSTNLDRFPNSRQMIGSPKILTQENSNLLLDRLLVGETGSDVERGLEAMEVVLSSEYLNSEAKGFIRSDALLAIVIIGDEDDQSSKLTKEYIDFLNRLKPNFPEGGQSWLVNFIGVLQDTYRCGSISKTFVRSIRYAELVSASGGISSSICDRDLTPALQNINARLVDILTSFQIDSEPDLATLVVKVDGLEIALDSMNGYQYVSQKDSLGRTGHYIKFYGTSVPSSDSKISVTFTPKSSK